MIWFLLDEIRKIENEKVIVGYKLKVFLTYAIYFATQVFAVCIRKIYLAYIFDIIALILSFIYIRFVYKKRLDSIDAFYFKYMVRLANFKIILKKYKLYTKEQVMYLIQLCNEQKVRWKLSEELAKPFNIFLVSLVIPTLLLILNWLFNQTNVTIEMVKYAAVFISSIMVVIAVGIMVKPAIKRFTDREYYRFAKLSEYLQDILLIDFSNDERK